MRQLPTATLVELERTAVQLAQLAGQYIHTLPLDALAVRFKAARPGAASNADPVSNVDREVEARLRHVVAERFPRHVVIGEEHEEQEPEDAPFIWVIDPLDGTTNYLNGLPLFASSIGVLHRHVPVAGAIWCACTHERRPGIYHAHHEGVLSLDGVPLARKPKGAWRGLASEPGDVPRYGAFFETRVLASAALECAFAAAGVLRVAYLARPAIWDVAAGVVLARVAGCRVLTRRENTWQPLTAFSAPNARKRIATLRSWRQPVLIGDPHAVDREAAVATALD
ncbi:MAG TPA: inositol monophosphatase family protein [Steroidobacteraceae bacterium]|nr:inositol monophosphatase family protein [Steroidobacteraceae bacterium]